MTTSMGRVLIIPGLALTDTAAPKLVTTDALESAGSLLLLDATHPAGGWASGVPAGGSALRNVLWEKAQAVYGAGTEASLSATLNYTGMSGANGLLERSAKGGLHAIISQAAGLTAANATPYTRIQMDAELRKWLFLNPTNDLYISVWGHITRAYKSGAIDGTYTADAASALVSLATGASNQRLTMGYKTQVHNELGKVKRDERTAGAVFMNAASSAWVTNPASATATVDELVSIGNTGSNNTYQAAPLTAKSRWASWLLYRLYVEDLTVSGRTYQQVHDIDYAQYQKHVLTPGGRYYGDTYTAPATLP